MSYKLTIEGETIDELVTNLRDTSKKLIPEYTTSGPSTVYKIGTVKSEGGSGGTTGLTEESYKKTTKRKITLPENESSEVETIGAGGGAEVNNEETKPIKFNLDEDVIPAFKAYAKTHSREKAGEILSSFNVKSVRDLNPKEYPKVMGMLT